MAKQVVKHVEAKVRVLLPVDVMLRMQIEGDKPFNAKKAVQAWALGLDYDQRVVDMEITEVDESKLEHYDGSQDPHEQGHVNTVGTVQVILDAVGTKFEVLSVKGVRHATEER